ncbi:DUF4350 domain-containing protein [Salinibaculum salinum]|uniref:DUF4350 domain-containing protein n=1 Tax=Salinibaculum salinum TaxID=3131996 RepID=UPI0030EDAF5D
MTDERDPDDVIPWSYPRLLLYALAGTLLISLFVAASTSGAAFGTYNPGWDGASQLRAEADAVDSDTTLARNVDAYDSVPANETTAVILSPDSAYGDDAARVREFVRAGGTAVVAEDFNSHSNDLLAAVGATARIDGRLLRDEQSNYRSPAMPVATNTTNHTLVDSVDRLTLNHGTVIEPNNASVLVASSEFGYLDENGNDELDDNETLASYPVATVESVGEGRVVVVSDPSLAINAMVDRPDNRAFIQSLFAGQEHVLLDYSHAERLPPLAVAALTVRDSPLLQVLAGLALITVAVSWVRRPALLTWLRSIVNGDRNPNGPQQTGTTDIGEHALVDHLLDDHPEWSRDRAERVVRATRREPADE